MSGKGFTANATGSGRNKVALPRGKSLMDWIRLGESGVDLTGVGGRLISVTPNELAKHDKSDDCWMAIAGRVYNVSQYNSFHPGGMAEIMKGAGKDATHLFNEVHRWVNFESMLKRCLVGRLISGGPNNRAPQFGNLLAPPRAMGTSALSTVNTPQKAYPTFGASSQLPPPSSSSSSVKKDPKSETSTPTPAKPKYDFHQTSTTLAVTVYTRIEGLSCDRVIVLRADGDLLIKTVISNKLLYVLHFTPYSPVIYDCQVRVKSVIGKVEVIFTKSDQTAVNWSRLGTFKSHHNTIQHREDNMNKVECTVVSKSQTTHDTQQIVLALPEGFYMSVPTGKHVRIQADIQGMEIAQSYTPVKMLDYKQVSDEWEGTELLFLIKIYPDGALTPHIAQLKPGNTLTVSEWIGEFELELIQDYTRLLLLAAGTGITPMLSLIHSQLQSEERKITLIFYNKTEQDIIWSEELQQVAATHKRLKVIHVLSRPNSDWSGLSGYVQSDHIKPHLKHKSHVWTAICGPKPFIQSSQKVLQTEGLDSKQIYLFDG